MRSPSVSDSAAAASTAVTAAEPAAAPTPSGERLLHTKISKAQEYERNDNHYRPFYHVIPHLPESEVVDRASFRTTMTSSMFGRGSPSTSRPVECHENVFGSTYV